MASERLGDVADRIVGRLGEDMAAEAEEQERTLHRQLWERIEEGYVFVRGATTSKVAVRFKGHYVALGPDLPSAVRAAQEHSEKGGE